MFRNLTIIGMGKNRNGQTGICVHFLKHWGFHNGRPTRLTAVRQVGGKTTANLTTTS
ncbi:MAG: hypothetical protein FWG68_05805 [Defluviitaleaceae bacterium]|nr:hypothetical protein [Defluviitaleaceae bacterium]